MKNDLGDQGVEKDKTNLGGVAQVLRLPKPRERDPIANASRTWLIATNAALPPPERFLFSVARPGKNRGAVFLNPKKLVKFLRKAEAASAV